VNALAAAEVRGPLVDLLQLGALANESMRSAAGLAVMYVPAPLMHSVDVFHVTDRNAWRWNCDSGDLGSLVAPPPRKRPIKRPRLDPSPIERPEQVPTVFTELPQLIHLQC